MLSERSSEDAYANPGTPYRLPGRDTVLTHQGGIYMLGRIAHAIGMDGGRAERLRGIGTMITMLTLLGLAVVAVLIALGRF